MDSLNVVSIKWGSKYPALYVNILYSMVVRNLSVPFKFYCLTEDSKDIRPEVKCLPFDVPLGGWWNKISLFRPNIGPLTKGHVLYLDLDIVVVDRLEPVIEYEPSKFCIIRNYSRDRSGYNSSIMKFEIGKYSKIWDTFEIDQNVMRTMQGDQDFITSVMKHFPAYVATFPEGWINSYKWGRSFATRASQPEGTLLKDTKISVFHGKPKPHQVIEKNQWVKENWRI